LDHSLIFYGAGMSDGQAHAPYPLPLVAVGRGGGAIKGDRFIVAPEWTPIANLWLSVANLYGIRLEKFAESNGRVEIGGCAYPPAGCWSRAPWLCRSRPAAACH